jgi:nucleoside 2-deoxyribosyltransferase
MPANADLAVLYQEAIEPAIIDNRMTPFLMTRREPEETINAEILEHLASSRLIISDLTYERPNCYYEVGYAHGKNRKVILTAREDHDPRRPGREMVQPKIHFDLDSHRVSFWREGEWNALRAELSDRIAEYTATRPANDSTGDPSGQDASFSKTERLMPQLLAEMRADLAARPLCREMMALRKGLIFSSETPHFQYYYDDHEDLDGKLRILENLGFIRDVRRDDVPRFVIEEPFADYLLGSSPAKPKRDSFRDV